MGVGQPRKDQQINLKNLKVEINKEQQIPNADINNRHPHMSPPSKVQKVSQKDIQIIQLKNLDNQNIFMKPSKQASQAQSRLNQNDILEEEDYGNYLDTTKRQSQMNFLQNENVISQSTIRFGPQDEKQCPEMNLQHLRNIQENRESAVTPTAQLHDFAYIKQPGLTHLEKKHMLVVNEEKAYHSGGYGQQKRNRIRENTYESEHSSIFNENISIKDCSNRNNLPIQYAHKLEDQKRIPVDTQLAHTEGDGGTVLQSTNSNNNGASQQFLEMNLKMSNLSQLNEKMLQKNLFLRTIDIRNNQIAVLPDCLCDLAILWKLRADFNLISGLPKNFGRLQRLEVLTLSNNKISELPRSFYFIGDKLTMIHLNDNSIKSISRDIKNLKKLKILHIHNNQISRIPNEFQHLIELNEFSLEWFQYLQPAMSKILKDERGLIMIKDFQKFCKVISEIDAFQKCSFIYFLAFFHKLQDSEQLQNMYIYPKKRSVVHYLSLYGHLHLLKELVSSCQGIDLNYCDADKTTPLALAFKNKQMNVINYLMKFPISNFNKGSLKYGYPMHLAIKNHDFKLVLRILKPKYVININARDEEGNNALHYLMSHYGYEVKLTSKIGNILLKKGIDVNILNKNELSPLHIAIKNYQHKSLKYALDYNQFLREKQKLEEKEFQRFSHPQRFKNDSTPSLIRSNSHKYGKLHLFNFNVPGKLKQTPLHFAVLNNNLIAVEILLYASYIEKVDLFARDADCKLAQELCPYNSPIYKMIIKKQNQHIKLNLNTNYPIQPIGKIEHSLLNRKQLKVVQLKKQAKLQKIAGMQLHKNSSSKNILTKSSSKNLLGLNFGAQEEESEDELKDLYFHPNQIKGRDSLLMSNHPYYLQGHRNNNESHSGKHPLKLNGLSSSKTEKNLHSVQLLKNVAEAAKINGPLINFTAMQEQNQSQLSDRSIQKNILEGIMTTKKQSPRIQQAFNALPPKQLLSTDDGCQELMDMDDVMRQDLDNYQTIVENVNKNNLQFISNDVNFCTDEEDAFSDAQSQEGESLENVTSTESSFVENIGDGPLNGQKFQENYFSHKRQSDQVQGKAKYLVKEVDQLGSKVFEIKEDPYFQGNYSSAPSQKKNLGSRRSSQHQSEYVIDMQRDSIRPQKLEFKHQKVLSQNGVELIQRRNERPAEQIKSERDEDDDFCCAAEEDAEAGALGLIANKINKFENHNIIQEIDYRSNNEKTAMKVILFQLSEQKQKRKQNREKMRSQQQLKHNNKNSLLPLVQRDLFEEMRLQMQTPQNEKIFKDASPSQMSPSSQKKEEGNVFDTVELQDEQTTPIASYNNKQQTLKHFMEREQVVISEFQINEARINKRNSKLPNKDQVHSMQSGFGILKDLNKECNLEENEGEQFIDELGLGILSDPTISLAQKYQIVYKAMYSKKSVDFKTLKRLYDLLDQNNDFSILKADLSYLMCISKSKEMIPALDQAIGKLKVDTIKVKGSQVQANLANNKVVKAQGEGFEAKGEQKEESKHIRQKSNCSQILLYETFNAYDFLMKELLHTTNQQMEQCNQKIHVERERSRERMKLKQLNSTNLSDSNSHKTEHASLQYHPHHRNQLHKYQVSPQIKSNESGYIKKKEFEMASQASIREVPELVARLNKSPSTQTMNQGRQLEGFVTQGSAHIYINLENEIKGVNLSNVDTSLVAGSSLSQFQKKTSFTPKGSSGQVFLAFQRQKQSQNQLNQNQSCTMLNSHKKDSSTRKKEFIHLQNNLENEELQLSFNEDDIKATIINLSDENYNETILNVQRPHQLDLDKVRINSVNSINLNYIINPSADQSIGQVENKMRHISSNQKFKLDNKQFDTANMDSELAKQKIRLEQYIQKRQDELKKQQTINQKGKEVQSLAKQRFQVNQPISMPTVKSKQISSKKLRIQEKLVSPTKVIDLSNEQYSGSNFNGFEDRFYKKTPIVSSQYQQSIPLTAKKPASSRRGEEGKVKSNNKSSIKASNKSIMSSNVMVVNTMTGAVQQSSFYKSAMKKSTSTSKLMSDNYYLQN